MSGAPESLRALARNAALVLLVVAGVPGTVVGQARFEGYAKQLAVTSRSVMDGERYLLDVSRLRLQAAWLRGPWHAEAWLDTELQAGSWFGTPEAALGADLASAAAAGKPFLDLDWELDRASRHVLTQRIFRGTVAWAGPGVTVTAGRQRVAWGTGFVWNPTDVLHPLDPAALERDEKAAVDAVQVVVPLGVFSAVEAVFAPGRTAGAHRTAARLRAHAGEYDVTLLGGRFGRAWIVGGDFAGYVGDAAWRGELAWTRSTTGRWTLRAVTNVDYTFSETVYGFVEAHFNGPGASNPSAYDRLATLSGGAVNLARWYAAGAVSWTASPLTSVSGYAVHNLGDGSSLVGPIVTRSLAENLDAAVGYYLFRGGRATEYGAAHDAAFLTLQYFF